MEYSNILPGKPKQVLKDQIAPMIEQGLSHNEIAQQLGCSWRYVAMVKADLGLVKPQATQKAR